MIVNALHQVGRVERVLGITVIKMVCVPLPHLLCFRPYFSFSERNSRW